MNTAQEAYPKVEHLNGASLRQAPALLANIRLDWKGFSGTNTGANLLKLLNRNLLIPIINWSICPWQAFPAKIMCMRKARESIRNTSFSS